MARGFNSVPDTIILYANTATYKKVVSFKLFFSRYPHHTQTAILFILMNPLFLISFLFYIRMVQVRTMMNSKSLLPAHS
jgi:hypothetical protein